MQKLSNKMATKLYETILKKIHCATAECTESGSVSLFHIGSISSFV